MELNGTDFGRLKGIFGLKEFDEADFGRSKGIFVFMELNGVEWSLMELILDA